MILLDGRTIGPHLSGIGRYTLNLLVGLDTAFTQASAPGMPGPVKVWLRPEVLRGADLPGVITRSPALDLIEYPGEPQQWGSLLAGHRDLRRLGVALVHCPDVFVPWAARCRRVVTLHDVIPLVCRGQLRKSRKQKYRAAWRAWMKLQTRQAIRSGGGIITVSETSGHDIHRQLGVPRRHLHVIPNAPPPGSFRGGTESLKNMTAGNFTDHHDPRDADRELQRLGIRGPFILNVGRRDPYKNVDGLVRAFAKMREQFDDLPPNLQLVIVGQPDPRYPEAEREAERLQLGDAVVFTNYVSETMLEMLYDRATLLAMPSLYEGFGLPAVEAMRAGLPVVAGSVASLPEVIGDAGLLFDAHRPDAMAEAMHKVLVDHELQAILIERGLNRAGEFSIARCGAAHLALYQTYLSDSGR